MKITIFFTALLSLSFINIAYANDIENNIPKTTSTQKQQDETIKTTDANTDANSPKIPQIDIAQPANNENQQPKSQEADLTQDIKDTKDNNMPSDSKTDIINSVDTNITKEEQEIQKEIIKNMFGAKTDPKLIAKLDDVSAKLQEINVKIATNQNNDSNELKLLILAIVGICFILFITTVTTLMKLNKLNKLLLKASQ
jgi:hypothetical protein